MWGRAGSMSPQALEPLDSALHREEFFRFLGVAQILGYVLHFVDVRLLVGSIDVDIYHVECIRVKGDEL